MSRKNATTENDDQPLVDPHPGKDDAGTEVRKEAKAAATGAAVERGKDPGNGGGDRRKDEKTKKNSSNDEDSKEKSRRRIRRIKND